MAVWIKHSQLPTKFYDTTILEQADNKVGKLLKIDTCTSSTLRGRYARICVQVPLDIPVTTKVIISTHNQALVYEGEGVLCTGCGRIGHTLRSCEFLTPVTQGKLTGGTNGKDNPKEQISEWRTVTFSKHRRQTHKDTLSNPQVKRFDASLGP
uniref:Uncharacterized protein LOC104233720 n=1 Tax=Nicotiana sylvestris TaxID=4096 RepID=A0A1U7XG82_NICSY|nr:PREDICTED: uncharacterized protein LOC104233720 [Nicotiana sylvestris]